MGEQIGSQFGNGIGAITAYLPHLVSAIVIAAIGIGVSLLVRTIPRRLLGKTGFDRLVGRHVDGRAVERRPRPSDAVASTLFWITAALTADPLELHALAAGLKRIIGHLPNALVAAVILAVGIAVARMIGPTKRARRLLRVCRSGRPEAPRYLIGLLTVGDRTCENPDRPYSCCPFTLSSTSSPRRWMAAPTATR